MHISIYGLCTKNVLKLSSRCTGQSGDGGSQAEWTWRGQPHEQARAEQLGRATAHASSRKPPKITIVIVISNRMYHMYVYIYI